MDSIDETVNQMLDFYIDYMNGVFKFTVDHKWASVASPIIMSGLVFLHGEKLKRLVKNAQNN